MNNNKELKELTSNSKLVVYIIVGSLVLSAIILVVAKLYQIYVWG